MDQSIQLKKAIEMFLENIKLTRSENTEKTYGNAMHCLIEMLESEGCDPDNMDVSELSEDIFGKFAKYLKYYSPATEGLYINVAKNFFEFLSAENLRQTNLYQIKLLINQRTRKMGVRLPQFPADDIEKMLTFAEELCNRDSEDFHEKLINMRDGAFLITLADTGLRIHEACNLRRGDIDWFKKKAIIIGKGNKQAVVRFSDRSTISMRNYLFTRGGLDGNTGRQLSVLPVFARHDKGAGKNILPITTKTGRLIVAERVKECLGEEAVGTITPHSFRHYFVTCVLQETGNLKIAQEFARHTNIAVTQRYAHIADNELDETYRGIFDDKK